MELFEVLDDTGSLALSPIKDLLSKAVIYELCLNHLLIETSTDIPILKGNSL